MYTECRRLDHGLGRPAPPSWSRAARAHMAFWKVELWTQNKNLHWIMARRTIDYNNIAHIYPRSRCTVSVGLAQARPNNPIREVAHCNLTSFNVTWIDPVAYDPDEGNEVPATLGLSVPRGVVVIAGCACYKLSVPGLTGKSAIGSSSLLSSEEVGISDRSFTWSTCLFHFKSPSTSTK